MTSRLVSAAALLALVPVWARAQDAGDGRLHVRSEMMLGAEYSLVAFQENVDPWHLGALSYWRRSERGSLVGRVNVANRFTRSGAQVEIDAYPRLSPNSSTYAYVNLGFSASDIFPRWRSGVEVYTGFPRGWEGSLGYRQLRFTGGPVTLFTGALGKYSGNYWLSLRPYVRHSSGVTTASTHLTARRYFADSDHYYGARIGGGNTISDQQSPDAASLARDRSVSASVHGSGDLTPSVLGNWSLGFERERLAATATRTGWSVTTGLRFRL